jgi:hypothetical protein
MTDCNLFWPKSVKLSNRILILLLGIIHILILFFVGTGWFLIPCDYKWLQLLYIYTVLSIIILFCIFQKCVLQILKERLYTNRPINCNLNILPVKKKPMMLIFVLLSSFSIIKYFYCS